MGACGADLEGPAPVFPFTFWPARWRLPPTQSPNWTGAGTGVGTRPDDGLSNQVHLEVVAGLRLDTLKPIEVRQIRTEPTNMRRLFAEATETPRKSPRNITGRVPPIND